MVSGGNKRVYGQNIHLGPKYNFLILPREVERTLFLNLKDEMKGLELVGHNGTIEKLRAFKERAKVKIGKRLGSKCNFTNL